MQPHRETEAAAPRAHYRCLAALSGSGRSRACIGGVQPANVEALQDCNSGCVDPWGGLDRWCVLQKSAHSLPSITRLEHDYIHIHRSGFLLHSAGSAVCGFPAARRLRAAAPRAVATPGSSVVWRHCVAATSMSHTGHNRHWHWMEGGCVRSRSVQVLWRVQLMTAQRARRQSSEYQTCSRSGNSRCVCRRARRFTLPACFHVQSATAHYSVQVDPADQQMQNFSPQIL